ncbi:replication-relaxation family protein [Svornostia abyssi]|uniref:Replication-relaxation family protein n=1 Tax=Svornostia abyssi TaxID=2898438 RepID=A0ABY5PA25_9ACTN|nr:replication-relaxation family protein [Parviterribacteraceae bacterium J379]
MSASRLREISSELTDQDWAVVRFIASTRLATGTQLARRLWASEDPSDAHARAARRALHRLEAQKLIGRLGRRLGGVRAGSSSIVYRLESAGHRLISPGRKKPIAATSYDTLAHTLAVTELLVQLHEHTAHGELEIASIQTEPGCWRRFPGAYGGLVTLKPDLFAVLAGPVHQDRYFVEVDLATESPARIRAKAKRYLEHLLTGTEQRAHGAYPRVVFTAPHLDRAAQLETALGGLDPLAAKLFVVWHFDEVAGRMVSEATA